MPRLGASDSRYISPRACSSGVRATSTVNLWILPPEAIVSGTWSRPAGDRSTATSAAELPDPGATPAARQRDLYRLGPDRYRDLVRLAAADALEAPCGRVASELADALAAANDWEPKSLPVDGHDVMALGVPAGPRVGRILAALETWWIERDFAPDRAACLAQARRLVEGGRDERREMAKPEKP